MENERQSQSERESIRETKREKKIERNGKEGESEMIGKGDGMKRISNTVTVSRALCLFFYFRNHYLLLNWSYQYICIYKYIAIDWSIS